MLTNVQPLPILPSSFDNSHQPSNPSAQSQQPNVSRLGYGSVENTGLSVDNFSGLATLPRAIGSPALLPNHSVTLNDIINPISPLLPVSSAPVPIQSRANGNHLSVSSLNANRHANFQPKGHTITNGFSNGNSRSVNSPINVNGLGSPGNRKSRESRDNSPIPPTFSRQNVKIEPSSKNSSLYMLNKEELKSINLRNQNMRQVIYKEVKKPGKNHAKLVQMLREDLHGPPPIRREYIKEVIAEAARFKRKALVELLEQKMDELIASTAT